MAKVKPNQIFPTVTVDAIAGTAEITLTELKNVVAAEITPTTGDFGILLRGIVEAAYEGVQALAVADRPVRWGIVRSSETVVPNVSNSRRVTYTITFDMSAPANQFELLAE